MMVVDALGIEAEVGVAGTEVKAAVWRAIFSNPSPESGRSRILFNFHCLRNAGAWHA